MSYVTQIFNMTYWLITNLIGNTLFQFFLYMIILLFIIKATRAMICTI